MKEIFIRKDLGITLIALVITIIILLILTAISIKGIIGENGIIESAKWSEYVTEYETVDEAKNLYVTEKTIDKYGKAKRKFTIKSLFISTSLATNEKETIYPVDINQKILVKDTEETLKQTICYIEDLELSDLYNEEKVELYKVDFSILDGLKVKREYIINIVSGMLYSIQGHEFRGKIYHTPREGIKKEQQEEPDTKPEDPTKVNLKIHYLSGYDNTEYIQEITEISENITLKPVEYKRENYTFIHWEDVTSEKSTINIEQTEKNEEGTIEFTKLTGGYYDVVNTLINTLGEEWEGDIIDIIENDKDYEPDLEDEEAAPDIQTQTKNDILEYLEDVRDEIQNKLSGIMTIEGLAEWLISNEEYIINLQKYEQEIENEGIEEDEEKQKTTYKDQESGIEVKDSDIWLEAVWTDNPITLNANGGNINGEETIKIGVIEGEKYGEKLNIEPTKTNYVFTGWYTKENIQKTSEDICNMAELSDKTIYAHWEEETSVKLVTITYNANGGECEVNIAKKEKDKKYGTMPTATRNNFAFLGWYTEAIGGTKITENTIVTGNTTLYAQWGNKLTMYYDLQGGQWRDTSEYKKMNPATSTVYMGTVINFRMPGRASTSRVSLSIKARKGYKFRGWYMKPKGEGEKIEKGTKITQKNNFTIYANWEGKCTIMYDANKGVFSKKTGIDKKTKQKYAEGTYPKISKPIREGYTFEGWYDAPEGGNKIIINNKDYKIQEDTTLYAHWIDNVKPQTFTISVENLTTEGFTMNLSRQIDLGTGIAEVKYYVNETKTGEQYQESNKVTGLSKDMTKYVWAEITDRAGNTRRSTNYVKVETEHEHTEQCYSTSYSSYGCTNNGTYKDTLIKAVCTNCSEVDTERMRGYINTNYYYNITNGYAVSYHYSGCGATKTLDYYNNNWTTTKSIIYKKCCPQCGHNLVDNKGSEDTNKWRCRHATKYLSCTKSVLGNVTSNKF